MIDTISSSIICGKYTCQRGSSTESMAPLKAQIQMQLLREMRSEAFAKHNQNQAKKMEITEGIEYDENRGHGRLVQMCIAEASKSKEMVEIWRRQRRTLERMPHHLAGPLFHCLLKQRLLTPSLLEAFQQSIEEVNLKGETLVDAEWMAYLGAYRHLRVANLADCKAMNDSGLWHLAGMTTLEELDLSRCSKITDAGVEHLLSLLSLKKLSISETGIKASGAARLSILTSLTSLDMGGLPVTDSVVSSLQVLTLLQQLDMWGSQISNRGVALLKAFPKLNFLNLAWTNATQVPVLFSLKSLNMSNCTIDSILDGREEPEMSLLSLHFSGAIFINVSQVFSSLGTENVSLLDLSSSSVDNAFFLAGMNKLECLDLSCTAVTTSSMTFVADIGPNLKQLNLSSTKVSSEALSILAGNVPKLEFISLSYTTVDDGALAYLGLMSALRRISLSHTNIKGFVHGGENGSSPIFSLAFLQQLEHLEILDLENTHVSDLACQPLTFLKELRCLSLRSDFLSDISLLTVSSLPKLNYLSLQGAVVTNPGLCSFIPPSFLRVLDLRDCWLLTKEGILKFSRSYPQLELRHESLVMISEEQTFHGHGKLFSGESLYAAKVKRGRKPASRIFSPVAHDNRTQRRFVDERIKYSKLELLQFRASPCSVLSLSELNASLPESLEKK
ncbi:uncharacterized protein LOC131068958 isoform X2 [Cryptomeria japonica]|uniref:uncharacterized protein LOC131068958 isoform X2 n=1 Tax=Cryptomeria japonica TaxID=3369 RepID=UPI0027D9E750|nr:uncharacterized protein LOC131068958 isoform X2 [Cryptomeria japonica]